MKLAASSCYILLLWARSLSKADPTVAGLQVDESGSPHQMRFL